MFNLYFAGSVQKVVNEYIAKHNGNRLFSYINESDQIKQYQDIKNELNSESKLFIDSGAFSVAHAGAIVDVDTYIEWINNNSHLGVFAQLDTIPYPILNQDTAKTSAYKSMDNYLYMIPKLNHPEKLIPIFHYGESKQHLLDIVNTKINGKYVEYIGMGGRHGISSKAQEGYFKRMFEVIKSSNNPNVKVHAFGMTALKLLTKFPFYSADSTTYLQLAINGDILYGDGSVVTVSAKQKHSKHHLDNMPQEIKDSILAEIVRYGFSYEDICENYNSRIMYNIAFLINWCKNYKYNPDVIIKNNLINLK